MFWYDWSIIIVIPAMILAFFAQMKVTSNFNRFSNIPNQRGLTGADVARQLLQMSGITDVQVEMVRGTLTDHYDPRSRTLRLSQAVYGSQSLSALSVAAHETGHALQHHEGYFPLSVRSAIVPVVNIGSSMAMPMIVIGLLFTSFLGSLSDIFVNVGILMFAFVVFFQLITLPVEFDASSRAIYLLESHHFLDREEIVPAKKVLNAAALTYLASAAVSIANLLRILVLTQGRNRRN